MATERVDCKCKSEARFYEESQVINDIPCVTIRSLADDVSELASAPETVLYLVR